MTIRWQALAVAALAGLAAGACGGDDERSAPRSEPLLGVAAGEATASPQLLRREIRVMADSGVTALRVPFYWSAAQPYRSAGEVPAGERRSFRTAAGRPTSFVRTDWVVAAAAREGITLLPVVLGTPGWAARHPGLPNSPPAGTAGYARFLRALVERYGPEGSFWSEHRGLPKRPLRDWQLWNEPDHVKYWSDQPYARDYVRLARAAGRAIEAADPGARAIMAGFADRSWESLTSVYRAGGKGVFDAAAIHPYTFEPRNVLRIVRLARAALRRAGDGGQPLWLTEVTWSSGLRPGRPRGPFETTKRDQAARLARALPLLVRTRRELGVERIFWENWLSTDRDRGNPFDFSGLRTLRPDGSVHPKPAFAAWRRVALRVQESGD